MRVLLRLAWLWVLAAGILLLPAGRAAASPAPPAAPQPRAGVPTVPVVLFVGDASHFADLTQAMTIADGTSRPAPALIDAGPALADISASELRGVNALVVSGPVPAGAPAAVLESFVRNGSRLFVDAGDAPSLTGDLARSIPALMPVTGANGSVVGGQWNFGVARSPLTRDLDPRKWSPPAFQVGQPWSIQLSRGTRAGAAVLLRTQGLPVLVSARDGAGSVIWSGLNLPFHVDSFSNRTEARFLLGLLGVSGRPAARGGGFQPLAVGPYHLTGRLEGGVAGLIVTGVHGTIDVPGDSWSATIAGTAVTCLPVDTSSCYLPIPPGAGGTIDIGYRHAVPDSPAGVAADGLALVAALGLPFLLSARRARQRLVSFLSQSSLGRRYGSRHVAQAEMMSALRSADVAVRLSALDAMSAYPISPPWDKVLCRLARGDPSELVKERVAGLVALRQWEPVVSDEMRYLRRWAAQRQRRAPASVARAISRSAR